MNYFDAKKNVYYSKTIQKMVDFLKSRGKKYLVFEEVSGKGWFLKNGDNLTFFKTNQAIGDYLAIYCQEEELKQFNAYWQKKMAKEREEIKLMKERLKINVSK